MSILTHFPGTPRLAQTQILETLADKWSSHDVFVIDAPVATGKSRVAYTIAQWAGSGAIIVPNNILQSQYTEEFTDVPTIPAAYRHDCQEGPLAGTCAARASRVVRGNRVGYCRGCPYTAARARFGAAPVVVANYYAYLAHRAYRDVLIVDEAHNLLKMLTGDAAIRLWSHQWDYRATDIGDLSDLCAYLERCVARGYQPVKANKLLKLIRRDHTRLVLEHVRETWRGKLTDCVKVTQIDARGMPPIMYPPAKVHKLVLMSATISQQDIYDLGLDHRRVCYIHADSPIPAGNRPVVYLPTAKVAHETSDTAAPLLAGRIRQLLQVNRTSGILHCTYELAARLRVELAGEARLIWHTQANKDAQYRKWRATPGAVLVASGMYEGIDLPGDVARWQAICKIPYPNLGEPAIAYKADKLPEWYAWCAVRDVIQASGRICRTPTDYGATYILDTNWGFLYGKYRHLFPAWYRQAVR